VHSYKTRLQIPSNLADVLHCTKALGYNAVIMLLGIALIGCGGVAAGYRAAYANLPGTIYRLVIDADRALAESVAAELGIARFSTDWRDALSDDVQIVDVSTPNHLHAEQATALLAAGKHVLLQKPMAPSVLDCEQIVAAARLSKTTAAVYISDLDDPIVWDIREIVRSGRIGKISSVRARYAHRGGLNAPKQESYWRGSEEKTGGGSFIQLALHHLNLVSWLLDDRIRSVSALSKNQMCPNIGGDDTTLCLAEFERSGIPAVFESAWNSDGSALQIYGSEGSIHYHGTEGAAADFQLSGAFTGQAITIGASGIGRRERLSPTALKNGTSPTDQHAAFVRAVLSGSPPEVDASVGLYDVATVKAAYQAASSGQRVFVADMLRAQSDARAPF
jgi:predicted dehydrogenase